MTDRKYTGINKLFRNNTLQKYLDKFADGTFTRFYNNWKWIFKYTKRYKWFVLLYTFIGLFSSTLGIVSSYIAAMAINIIVGREIDKLAFMLALMIGTELFYIGFNAVKNRVQTNISIYVHNDIQAEIFDKIFDVKWDELNKFKHGDLLNRFNDDVNTISDNAISWIPDIIINIYTFVFTFIVLYRMDHIMAWIGLCSAPVLILISRYIMNRQAVYRRKVLELNSDMMSFETETFYNMDTVKAFGVWDVISSKLRDWQKIYKKNNRAYNMFQIKTNAGLSLMNTCVTVGAFCYCLYRLWHGQILYGDMTFFLTQRSALTSQFNSLVYIVPTLLNAAVSTHRIREIIELPKEEHDNIAYEKACENAKDGLSIELNNATFAYHDGTKVYDNASFVAKPGEIVAVLGESGGGKTTLFRLLLGLVKPETGEVVVRTKSGVPIEMNADIRRLVSYVPQGNTVLLGTIAENMRIVNKSATDEEIINALKIACAWDFVRMVGLDYQIGEGGKGCSEGQAQRLSIARAVLRDAPILFLDEATAALDEETEARVIDNVVRSLPNKTIIVSTHRPSVLRKCDRVYKIKNQKIVEL